MTDKTQSARDEAIANADAHLNNAGLPTFTEVLIALRHAEFALAARMPSCSALPIVRAAIAKAEGAQ